MGARILALVGACCVFACTDDNDAEGLYTVEIDDRDDGCGIGWIAGIRRSSVLHIAQYTDRSGEIVAVVALGSLPEPHYFLSGGEAFTGRVVDGDLLVGGGRKSIDLMGCSYFCDPEIHVEVRPNRFDNLVGTIDYRLVSLQSECSACVNTQGLVGRRQ
jgi:hypothetical protein